MKNKIGWCSMTWNPVWGCRNKCPYCYARRTAKRFWKDIFLKESYYKYKNNAWGKFENTLVKLENFKPTWLESNFVRKFPKKTQKIFVGSMSEINYWKEEWVERVLSKIKEYPQHIFMFLTQHPEVYAKYSFSTNCWYGVTMTRDKPIERAGCIPTKKGLKFLSIEPLLEKIDIEYIDAFEPDWIIVGAETGNRKEKIIPKKEWVEVVIDFCNRCNRPIYIKDNLVKYHPKYRELKEFPEAK